MYDNEYEEYMRSVLGYPPVDNTYYSKNIFPYRQCENEQNYSKFYPDIYVALNPIVSKVCNNYRSATISDDIIETMAMEVCNNFESNPSNCTSSTSTKQEGCTRANTDNLDTSNQRASYPQKGSSSNNVHTQDISKNSYQTQNISKASILSRNADSSGSKPCNNTDNNLVESKLDKDSTRGCTQCNPLLKDLIKILIINQLINNNQNRPPRPPVNPYPPNPRPPRPYRDFNNIDYY